jgi:hypothetical protein
MRLAGSAHVIDWGRSNKVLRHDQIQLIPAASAQEFEKFVVGKLFPVFKQAFGGPPTRKTVASLGDQILLKDQLQEGAYVLATTWSGPLEAIADPSFGRVTMEEHEDAIAALQKLDSFGTRGHPRVYEEVQ